jgi:hypothetical protein
MIPLASDDQSGLGDNELYLVVRRVSKRLLYINIRRFIEDTIFNCRRLHLPPLHLR